MISWNGPPDPEALLEEIADVVRRRDIEIVFPSDDVSTRLLAAIRDRLPVRSSPLPDLATFDLLNDKWNFTRFARDHDVRVPECWLYDGVDRLRGDLQSGALAFPITAKPTNCSGNRGVIHIRDESEIGELDTIDYRPILVQRHIIGETIGISVMCRTGTIVAHATQRRDEHRFELFANPDLVRNVERLVATTKLNGPANLDAVLEQRSGLAYIVECNPRFWYTIYMSMIVGLNFFDLVIGQGSAPLGETVTLAHGEICLSLKAIILRPWKATRQDWKFLFYHLGDPLLYFVERKKLFADTEVAVEAAQMQPYQPAPGNPIETAPALRA